MYRKSLFLLLLLSLQGCAAGLLVAGVSSVAINETTGKTLTDHAVSTVNNKDCRVARALTNEKVCQEERVASVTVTSAPSSNVRDQEDVFEKRRQMAKNANYQVR